MNIKLYIEVSKPRIVLVLVITAVASALLLPGLIRGAYRMGCRFMEFAIPRFDRRNGIDGSKRTQPLLR